MVIVPEHIGPGILFDQSTVAIGEVKIPESLCIDWEDATGGTVFRRHVGNGGHVCDRRHAGEILHQYTRRPERDLVTAASTRLKYSQEIPYCFRARLVCNVATELDISATSGFSPKRAFAWSEGSPTGRILRSSQIQVSRPLVSRWCDPRERCGRSLQLCRNQSQAPGL